MPFATIVAPIKMGNNKDVIWIIHKFGSKDKGHVE